MRRKWLIGLAAVLALNTVLWLAQTGFALPASLGSYFFGPKMVRAEVVVKDAGVLHDFRIDRGRITGISGSTLTLLERDRSTVSVPASPSAQITINGSPSSFSALRKRMQATTIRDNGAPAYRVIATTR
jgi:hypothetical protein